MPDASLWFYLRISHSLHLFDSSIKGVSPLVPALPGESDQGKRCLFLFWLHNDADAATFFFFLFPLDSILFTDKIQRKLQHRKRKSIHSSNQPKNWTQPNWTMQREARHEMQSGDQEFSCIINAVLPLDEETQRKLGALSAPCWHLYKYLCR